MANVLLHSQTEQSVEARIVHFSDRAISFEQFLNMAAGKWVDLVNGVVLEKPMIQLDHELCTSWLYQVIGPYVTRNGIGRMLSSRIMVKTDEFGGRMPDLLFVRQERLEIVQQKAVYGAPDLIFEIVSPGDRASHLQELEAEYFRMGVPELVFINLQKQNIHLLKRQGDAYDETIITNGALTFETLPNLTLQAEWILREPRPDVFDTLSKIFSGTGIE